MAVHLDQPVGIEPCVDVVFLELFGAHELVSRVEALRGDASDRYLFRVFDLDRLRAAAASTSSAGACGIWEK